uniref:Uncharacterized protein n=1 Tax=Zooxanthella nutricula TaxID=1333877 RepID=A0A7S2KXQ8_9DINO
MLPALPAPPLARCLAARGFASGDTSDASSGGGGGESKAGASNEGSDRQKETSGEYDTQEKYKRIGNPIQWANPTGGGSQVEDTSSKHWRWVYPAGVAFILLLCLYSRRKNLRKEQEEQVISTPNVQPPDIGRFTTPAYNPPPRDDDDGEELPPPSVAVGQGFGFGGSGGFSQPPSSQPRSGW